MHIIKPTEDEKYQWKKSVTIANIYTAHNLVQHSRTLITIRIN